MSALTKVAVDHAMRREEPLQLPFSSSDGSMRVLSTIFQVSALSVPDIRQQRAMRQAIATKAIGHQPPWLVLQTSQQSFEEAPDCGSVSAILDQDIKHDTRLANRTPEIMQITVDPYKRFIQMPNVAGPWPASAPARIINTSSSSQRGAAPLVYLTSSPKAASMSGLCLYREKAATTSAEAQIGAVVTRLWTESEGLEAAVDHVRPSPAIGPNP
jgi:hypothetical protein